MIKPLTSLRFFFAMMVLSSHLVFVIKPESSSILYWINKYVFSEGFIGVSFFFILSGFILSYTYQEKITGKVTSSYDFWIARIARIYPLHILTLLMAIPLILKDQLQTGWTFVLKLLLNSTLLQSFIPDSDYYFSLNSPSWSISDELFFYLLFPVLILFIVNNNKIKWIVFLLSIILIPAAVTFVDHDYYHHLFYINPVFRLIDFGIGIFLFNISKKFNDYFSSKKYIVTLLEAGSIALFVLFFVFHNKIPVVYRYSCYYWIPMACIILSFSLQKGLISRLLSHSFLIVLGEISFGIYLIHSIVIGYFYAFNFKFFHLTNDYIIIAIIFIVTVSLSYLIFIAYEKPCNRYIKNNARIRKLFSKKNAG